MKELEELEDLLYDRMKVLRSGFRSGTLTDDDCSRHSEVSNTISIIHEMKMKKLEIRELELVNEGDNLRKYTSKND